MAGHRSCGDRKSASGKWPSQTLLIADGHHRYEATLRYRDQLRSERGPGTGNEAYKFILTYFANIDDDNVVILPTHRLVRGFSHKPFLELEEALQTFFYVEQHPKTPEGKASFLKALKNGAKKHRVIGASFKRDPRYLILRLKNKRMMQRLGQRLERAAPRTRCQHAASADPGTYPRHVARGASQWRHHSLHAGRGSGACKRWKKKISKRRSF